MEVLRQSALHLFFGELFSSTDAAVRAVADYAVPASEDAAFVAFIEWINAKPKFIIDWRSDPETERRRYLRFMQGLDACRAGYAASSYHLQRVKAVEEQVHDILKGVDFSTEFRPGTVATLGTMRCFDFEYQAFVMAYRRALDGFSWGLSTYFGEAQSSFRRFAKHLPKYHPTSVADALFDVCERFKDGFGFVMDDERGKAVRDRMAHKEAVQAGTINVGAFGYRIIGGGEELGLGNFREKPPRLANVLQARLSHLQLFVAEMLGVFPSAVSRFEAEG